MRDHGDRPKASDPAQAWRYSINYGPDGQEDWANLITPDGQHVANIRTHHAIAIVNGLNASPVSKRVERLETALTSIRANAVLLAADRMTPQRGLWEALVEEIDQALQGGRS